jgi:hypothetical protein
MGGTGPGFAILQLWDVPAEVIVLIPARPASVCFFLNTPCAELNVLCESSNTRSDCGHGSESKAGANRRNPVAIRNNENHFDRRFASTDRC